MGRRTRALVLVGVLLAAATLSGCASDDAAGDAPTKAPRGTVDVVGTWGHSTTEGQAFLDLAEDGSASGSDGCNRLVGYWQAGEDGISFGQWATTRRACPDVDPWLSLSVAALVEGSDLVLLDENNTRIGTLQRTS